ncbi:MAG: hypothetical protein IPL94_11810 [Tetrasphaera sp.]|nr:hypothetical protein [Tetrasphaera sp.]
MNTINLALKGAWSVLSAGLIFGAGMPVIYALAIRLLSVGSTESVGADGDTQMHTTGLGRALMTLLMLVIVIAVALGILIILGSGLGKVVQFGGDFPWVELVPKKKK